MDPTTGVRDLTLFLEVAPLRALITRPRGGNELPSGSPPITNIQRGRRRSEPESRRRLQGTLLTCSIPLRRRPPPGEAEVVLLTADSSGDPKGRHAHRRQPGGNCCKPGQALDVTAEDRILSTVPLFAAYGFDPGLALALRYGATLYLETRSRRVASSSCCASKRSICCRRRLRCTHAGQAANRSTSEDQGGAFWRQVLRSSTATADAFRERWGVRIIPMYHYHRGQGDQLRPPRSHARDGRQDAAGRGTAPRARGRTGAERDLRDRVCRSAVGEHARQRGCRSSRKTPASKATPAKAAKKTTGKAAAAAAAAAIVPIGGLTTTDICERVTWASSTSRAPDLGRPGR